jgi:adenylate cyclase
VVPAARWLLAVLVIARPECPIAPPPPLTHAEARQRATAAVSVHPNSPLAHHAKGQIVLHSGPSPAEGRDLLLTALRLSPRDPRNAQVLNSVALSYYLEGDYATAAAKARSVIERYPDYALPYRWLAAALGQLGDREAAHKALCAAADISPRTLDFYLQGRPPWFRPDVYEHMMEGLRMAGWEG